MMDLAHAIKHMTGSASEVVLVPYEEAYEQGFEDMRRRVPDLAKIRRLINYEPSVALPKILSEIIEYHRGQRREAW